MAKEIPGKQQQLLWNHGIMMDNAQPTSVGYFETMGFRVAIFWLRGGRSSEDAARKGARVFSVRTPACSDGNGMTLKIGVKC
jgi:hypothetical protein